jgi:adenosylhomocysteine nucleosidase
VADAVGIVVALEMERGWITNPGPLVEVSGVGFRRAEGAAQRLVEQGATALVSWGMAGGLDPDLRSGTVVLPEAVVETNGSRIETDREWRDRLVARVAGCAACSTSMLLEVERVIADPEEKSRLNRQTGAGAADMESAAVGRVAAGIGIPWIAVRVVLDTAAVRLPDAALQAFDEEGRLKRQVLLRLVGSPRIWWSLVALGWASTVAGRSMRRMWSLAGPDLAYESIGDR